MDKLKMETKNLTEKNIEKIAKLFPNVITEMKDENGKLKKGVNFELLKQELSEEVIDGEECYDFTWVGKKAAIVESNTPIRKTLRPCIEESKDWENTENLYIEGDNLEVLKLLQESYLNSIKMIYIDPPYNTGNDFIYKDNFKIDKEEYEDQIGLYDEEENMMFKNTDTNGRFHSDWCSMMYPRLKLAQSLLSDDGIIFISIDDNEFYNLKKICDEIFGESNFVCNFVRKNKSGSGHDSKKIAIEFDYILLYAKNYDMNNINQELMDVEKDNKYRLEDSHVSYRGKYYLRDLDYRGSYSESGDYPIICPDKSVIYPGGKFGKPNTWRWGKEKFEWGLKNDYIVFKKQPEAWKVYIKQYQFVDNNGEYYIRTIPYRALIDFSNGQGSLEFNSIMETNVFSYPKSINLIEHLLKIASNNDSIILDFFSGSSSTAHAVMQLNVEDGGNRKFIMVQLPEKTDENSEAYKAGYENICEIGKERIRRAGEKIKLEIEENNKRLKDNEETKKVPDIGFRVLKVDSTNMKDVYYSASEYTQEKIADLVSNIKEDRNDLDLLYGVMLDWGLPLSLKHEIKEIDGATVHIVDEGSLVVCFEENVSESVIREIAKLQPIRVVFRDSCFEGSPEKINVEEIFKLLAPNTTIKVI